MLSVNGITQKIGSRTVLDDVSFDAAPGRITGVLGPRGSGKTVLAHILMGLVDADEGSIELERNELTGGDRQNFGYLPAERGQYPGMRVLEQIVYFARLHGMTLGAAEKNGVTLLSRLDLADRAYATLNQLSGSEVARVEIASVLAADPDVVILDEPFAGLDAKSADLVFELLRDHADSGVPVLFLSSNWEMTQAAADDVIVLEHGRILAAGPVRELIAAGDDYLVRLRDAGDVPQALDVLASVGAEGLEADDAEITFAARSPEAASTALAALLAVAPSSVASFSPRTKSLAEQYREVL
ncbi:ABC transporter ATP-binding protein [Sediminivirga luteola]|uniref:ABC transporter ATP-binding protein n=1 Tax=Sediminivirga luteola TaxID=1774748 RepID=A0A8J2XJA0_9MICO|nr:ATP-binding cassette domain-containing protein [Sediminivirga luteola]GGA05046.1 ABC transporter ATP-binding protein [Sediminivirga luteola]